MPARIKRLDIGSGCYIATFEIYMASDVVLKFDHEPTDRELRDAEPNRCESITVESNLLASFQHLFKHD